MEMRSDIAASCRIGCENCTPGVLVAIGSFVLMVVSYRGLEQDFLPQEDKGRMFCMVITPNGSTSRLNTVSLDMWT